MKDRTVTATEFKAKCLAMLNEIDQYGGTITVTKRGRPVAVVAPSSRAPWKSLRNSFAGKIEIVGDIVNNDLSHLWNMVSEEEPLK